MPTWLGPYLALLGPPAVSFAALALLRGLPAVRCAAAALACRSGSLSRCLHGSALAWLRLAHRQSALLLMTPLACLEADAYTAWWPPGSQPYCCCCSFALEALFAEAHTSRRRPAPPCSQAVRPAAAVAAARPPSRLALPMSAGLCSDRALPDSSAASLLLRTSLAALLADAYAARLSPSSARSHESAPAAAARSPSRCSLPTPTWVDPRLAASPPCSQAALRLSRLACPRGSPGRRVTGSAISWLPNRQPGYCCWLAPEALCAAAYVAQLSPRYASPLVVSLGRCCT
jgi:hypothetical protein